MLRPQYLVLGVVGVAPDWHRTGCGKGIMFRVKYWLVNDIPETAPGNHSVLRCAAHCGGGKYRRYAPVLVTSMVALVPSATRRLRYRLLKGATNCLNLGSGASPLVGVLQTSSMPA